MQIESSGLDPRHTIPISLEHNIHTPAELMPWTQENRHDSEKEFSGTLAAGIRVLDVFLVKTNS